MSRSEPTPARRAAYAVVHRVFEEGAYADRALHGEARELEPRERALAHQLAFGTVQRARTLDHVIERLARPPQRLDAPTRTALRLGLFQLLFLDGVAEYAAVTESVELARAARSGGHGLVNAVLRRATREGRALVDALPEGTAPEAAVRHSLPDWIATLWWEAYGPDTARALMAASNEPAEHALRVNTLVVDRDALAHRLPVPCHPAPDPELREGLVIDGPFDAHGSPLWTEGLFMPQSRGAMLVAALLAPHRGERILDLCAAPGGKTTHLAALMGGEGEVVAVERHAGRAGALERTAARLRAAPPVQVLVGDAAHDDVGTGYDRVLVDPPCSGLGTLRHRPDVRWRASPEAARGLVAQQTAILSSGAAALRPGGTLAYAVCTLNPAEADGPVEALTMQHPELELVHRRTVWPHRDATDGFSISLLRHTGRDG
ncbi:MAG TPA: 16S rRNA (cytosine(967)-C(5))-methyltransferase RsmB [Solirubrobacteraceae bacterium]|nr:16S rRNA (cytosine(967)-C(5))-methyltransferase RsmB [Solirubrobacteraceae bacterium]